MIRDTKAAAPKKHINPQAETLDIDTVADLFDLAPATIRKRIERGRMPQPVRRSPSIAWDAAAVYTWAYRQGLMSLRAVPLRHIRHIIDHEDVPGPHTARLGEVVGFGIPRRASEHSGVMVAYAGLTEERVEVLIHYPVDSTPEVELPERADREPVFRLLVTSEVAASGFYVQVHQGHPDYSYDMDWISTAQVAHLVGEAIPYWPLRLRGREAAEEPGTGRVAVTGPVVATPSAFGLDCVEAIEQVRQETGRKAGKDPLMSVLATISQDAYQDAEETARNDLGYAQPYATSTWALEEGKHLRIIATPAPVKAPAGDPAAARRDLKALAFSEPVGDSIATRRLGRLVADLPARTFADASMTHTQRRFTEELQPVQKKDATLAHLGITGQLVPGVAATYGLFPTFWKHPASGALAVHVEAVDAFPGYWRYVVPEQYPVDVTPAEIDGFDFEAHRDPFVLLRGGGVLPFPQDRSSAGYSLGYGGSGPQAVRRQVVSLLGLGRDAQVSSRWPFYDAGYPTWVPVAEMRAFFTDGR